MISVAVRVAVACLSATSGESYAGRLASYRDHGEPLLVVVGAEWCGPCRTTKDQLRRLKIPFAYIDVDRQQSQSLKVYPSSQGRPRPIPTFVVYGWAEGQKKRVQRIGPQSDAGIRAMLRQVGRRPRASLVWPPQRVVVKPQAARSPHPVSRHEQYRRKYGWVPDRHCGNRNCGMCNEIFGRPVRGRRTSMYTPHNVLDHVARMVGAYKDETFLDIGCGDGRVMIAVQECSGCRVTGIEIDKAAAILARWHVDDSSAVTTGDATKMDIEADVVYFWLFPELIEKLKLPGTARRIVSYMHDIPQLETTKHEVEGHTFFVWSKRRAG